MTPETRPKALVVEDVDLNRELLVQLLEERFEIVTAVDGREAFATAVAERPDVILMDIGLPMLDGLDAVRAIRSDPELATTPIIAVTSHAMAHDREEAFAAGCDEYLAKPIDEDILFEMLDRLVVG
jgi:two-component system cell cycle response regulator DivK